MHLVAADLAVTRYAYDSNLWSLLDKTFFVELFGEPGTVVREKSSGDTYFILRIVGDVAAVALRAEPDEKFRPERIEEERDPTCTMYWKPQKLMDLSQLKWLTVARHQDWVVLPCKILSPAEMKHHGANVTPISFCQEDDAQDLLSFAAQQAFHKMSKGSLQRLGEAIGVAIPNTASLFEAIFG